MYYTELYINQLHYYQPCIPENLTGYETGSYFYYAITTTQLKLFRLRNAAQV